MLVPKAAGSHGACIALFHALFFALSTPHRYGSCYPTSFFEDFPPPGVNDWTPLDLYDHVAQK